MKLSEHFHDWEFDCDCGCGLMQPHPDLIIGLEKVRSGIQVPNRPDIQLPVSSGCRCEAHNKAIGGDKDSWHKLQPDTGYCHAGDITCRNKARRFAIAREAYKAGFTDVGVYYWGLHLAVHTPPGLWRGSS